MDVRNVGWVDVICWSSKASVMQLISVEQQLQEFTVHLGLLLPHGLSFAGLAVGGSFHHWLCVEEGIRALNSCA